MSVGDQKHEAYYTIPIQIQCMSSEAIQMCIHGPTVCEGIVYQPYRAGAEKCVPSI